MRRLAVLFVLIGCHRKAPPTAAIDSGVAPVVAATSTTAVDASPPKPKRLTAHEVVGRWNDAHVNHDAKALESLYGHTVQFYGQTLSGKDCAARKGAAFAKSPTYTQSVKDLDAKTDGPSTTVSFTKTSTEKGKSTDYPAVLAITGGLITAETDRVTEANLAAKASIASMWCMDEPWSPNDKVVAPYKISAQSAVRRGRNTKHFAALEAGAKKGAFLDFGEISCPTKCVPATRECGYNLRVEDHSPEVSDNPEPHSNLVEWVYIDAISGVMYWDDGKSSEPLPH
jgi:hypothetical protein